VTAALEGALHQTWPPFVLVLGLLLIGLVVERDGLFAAVGARLERLGGSAATLLVALLALEAVVTAALNLDTAAVFVTPVLIHAARRRRCDRRPFVYGALLMANGASLLLPGSNLTNLIVLAHEHGTGANLARSMLPAWLLTVAVTIGLLILWYRPADGRSPAEPLPSLRLGAGAAATALATVLMLALGAPRCPSSRSASRPWPRAGGVPTCPWPCPPCSSSSPSRWVCSPAAGRGRPTCWATSGRRARPPPERSPRCC
jgi:arsenical pump membrane protein